MPLSLRCSYKAVQESVKHSEMLFSALQKLRRNRATFSFYVCEHFGKCKSLEFADGPLMMMMMAASHASQITQYMCCCLARLVAAVFIMGCVLWALSLPPPSLFVITAKPEPFVTIHCEQLLFSPLHAHTHTSSLLHTSDTHFIVFHIVLICVSTRGEKNALRRRRKSTVSKAVPEVSKKNFCIMF